MVTPLNTTDTKEVYESSQHASSRYSPRSVLGKATDGRLCITPCRGGRGARAGKIGEKTTSQLTRSGAHAQLIARRGGRQLKTLGTVKNAACVLENARVEKVAPEYIPSRGNSHWVDGFDPQ